MFPNPPAGHVSAHLNPPLLKIAFGLDSVKGTCLNSSPRRKIKVIKTNLAEL